MHSRVHLDLERETDKDLRAWAGNPEAGLMTDLPEPVTLEWIARQLVEVRDETDSLRGGLDALIEIVRRVETTTVALRDELRAFNEEERQRERLTGGGA